MSLGATTGAVAAGCAAATRPGVATRTGRAPAMTIGGSAAAALCGIPAAATRVLSCRDTAFAALGSSAGSGTAAASLASALDPPEHQQRSQQQYGFARPSVCAVRKSRISACSSRTSCSISAEAGTAYRRSYVRGRCAAIELILGEKESADRARQRRRQHLEHEFAAKTHQHRCFRPRPYPRR